MFLLGRIPFQYRKTSPIKPLKSFRADLRSFTRPLQCLYAHRQAAPSCANSFLMHLCFANLMASLY